MEKRLTLIRHGAIASRYDGCYVGRLDVPLSPAGNKQSTWLANYLTSQEVESLWCSPASRAQQTAAPAAKRLNLTLETSDGLNEVDFGQWEGLTFEQILANDPARVDEWAEMKKTFCFPGGESLTHFQKRVAGVAEKLRQSDSSHVAVVTHGGVIRSLVCMLLGLSAENYLKFDVSRGGFVTLDLYPQGAVLTGLYNEPAS